MKPIILVVFAAVILAGCETQIRQSAPSVPRGYTSSLGSESVGTYKVGNPYTVNGVRYVPHEDPNYDRTGIASWYGPKFHGRRTANGEVFDMYRVSAAHTTLPMPSQVKVTNLQNGKSIVVRVNDRGPFVDNRIIDLSYRAAQELGFVDQGTTRVRVQYYSPAVGAAAKPGVKQFEVDPLEAKRRAEQARQAREAQQKPAKVAAMEVSELPPLDEPPTQVAPKPVAEPAPKAEPKPTAGPRKEIHIQVGAFTDAGNAARLKEKVSQYHEAHIRGAMVNNQQFYRVRLGPFATQEEAVAIHSRLVEAGYLGARIMIERFMQ